ncbi:hypothetical protein HanXRQr2_Chr09g0383461 [Helianthus annuus]|uniref:Secreted protein n=1 Tax=Helianthus annuus TaxID=4232 RepID=A0A9K3I5Z0_HELAN|nr:hypothetical protein HanXRQr2_Chr09g0383461 [Helianthus annuus]
MLSRWLLLQLVQLNLCMRSVLLSNFCIQWFAFANCVPDEIVEDRYYNALAFHSLGSTSSPVNNQR